MKRMEKGLLGETHAARYLEDLGYTILKQRFRSQGGEVDIIAKNGEWLVFVEVKTWDSLGMETLEWSVNTQKCERIRQAATLFLHQNPDFDTYHVRFDLIFLSRKMGELQHWESAF